MEMCLRLKSRERKNYLTKGIGKIQHFYDILEGGWLTLLYVSEETSVMQNQLGD